ncbi:chaperonin GroEL [Chlamydia sp. 17-3921]|uniref:chaperonin GroEL n=1 Tax=Chlamydia sp. 17-3921 TaxID=2675798 RepID=UPI001917B10F|nr:chaperonin GroEL [Chlamydia sp. 17-3921]
MNKIFHNQVKGLQALHRGACFLTKAVSAALGPHRCRVVIQQGNNSPIVTRDGATLARREISLSDPLENLGAKIFKDVSTQMIDCVGDGIKTMLILAEALFSAGLQGILSGLEPQEIKQGILLASASMQKELEKLVVPIASSEAIVDIATMFADYDDVLGKLIYDAVSKVGFEGAFIVSENQNMRSSLEVISGMSLKTGYLSPYFVTRPDTMDIFWEEAFLLLIDQKIGSLNPTFIRFLDLIFRKKSLPLVIVARDFSKEVLNTLIVNKLKQNFPVCAVKISKSGKDSRALLEDLAIFSGASLVDEMSEEFLEKSVLDILGRVREVLIRKDSSIFLYGEGLPETREARKQYLRSTLAFNKSLSEIHFLEKRLARFSNGIANIKLGTATEIELKEQKNRAEKALRSTKEALRQGVVVGGGVAFFHSARSVSIPEGLSSGVSYGFNCLLQAVLSPLKTIAINCGKVPEEVMEFLVSQPDMNYGYNGITDSFENFFSSGICDPFAVTTASLKYAVSVSCLLLTSSFFVTNSPEIKSKPSK